VIRGILKKFISLKKDYELWIQDYGCRIIVNVSLYKHDFRNP